MSGGRLSLLAAATSAATLAVASPALASSLPLGVHVSACAQVALGQRVDPPAVTCTHDGHVHSFGTFDELVAHLQEQRE